MDNIIEFIAAGKSNRSDLTAAIYQLTGSEKEQLVPKLVELLQVPMGQEGLGKYIDQQKTIVYLLGILGPIAKPAVPNMVAAISTYFQVNDAFEPLSKVDPELAKAELVKAIPKAEHQLQRKLVDCLAEFGPSSIPLLTPFLAHWVSGNALIKFGPQAIPFILDQVQRTNIEETDGSSLCATAGGVLKSFDPEAKQPVLDALRSAEGPALLALMEMYRWLSPNLQSIEAAPEFCRAYKLKEGHMTVYSCLLSLGPPAIPIVCEHLVTAEADTYPKFRNILTSFGYSGVPKFEELLSHANPIVQINCAMAILQVTKSDDDAAVQKILQYLLGADDELRLVTLESLAWATSQRFGLGMKLVPSLSRVIHDPESSARKLTEHASEEMVGRMQAAIKAITKPDDAASATTTGWGAPIPEPVSPDTVISEVVTSKAVPPASVSTIDLPLMPTYATIKQTLESEFPEGVCVSWAGDPPVQVLGRIEFSASRGAQPRFVQRHLLVSVSIQGYSLKGGGGPPTGHTSGLYAYDGVRMSHIDGGAEAKKNLSDLLRSEFEVVERLVQTDPVDLANFFCNTLVPGFRHAHRVVEPADEQLNGSVVSKPSATMTDDAGCRIHFWTLESHGGCFPTVPTLREHTFTVSPDFEITYIYN